MKKQKKTFVLLSNCNIVLYIIATFWFNVFLSKRNTVIFKFFRCFFTCPIWSKFSFGLMFCPGGISYARKKFQTNALVLFNFNWLISWNLQKKNRNTLFCKVELRIFIEVETKEILKIPTISFSLCRLKYLSGQTNRLNYIFCPQIFKRIFVLDFIIACLESVRLIPV